MSGSFNELYSFMESRIFVKRVDDLGGIDLLTAIQDELLENPERGDIVQGLGGARKARIGNVKNKRGKRGGFRYLYLFLMHRGRIHLLYLYGKDEQDDLTANQKRLLAAEIADIKKGR